MRKKKKGTIKCDKRIVTCDIETAQCEDEIVKCDVLATEYNRLPTSEYRTQKKGYRRITQTTKGRKEIKETINVVTSETYINVVRR